jgi:anti-sigma factor RsiW
MTCRETIDLLADFLEQTLPADAATALERHLTDCAPCRAYLATYTKTRAIGAEAERVEMPEELKARLRRFLLDRLGRP